MKVIIVDDKLANIECLVELLKLCAYDIDIVGTAQTIEGAKHKIINTKNVDVVFLDIMLSEGTSFDILNAIDYKHFQIIFTTAYSEFALQAIKLEATDYLLKPIGLDELQRSLQRAERNIANKAKVKEPKSTIAQNIGKISLPVLEGFVFINHKDIVKVFAKGSYSLFYMTDKTELLVSLTLKECESILPEGSFYRTHNSYIVNLFYIERYHKGRGGHIVMKDGSEVMVSSSRKDGFLRLLNK